MVTLVGAPEEVQQHFNDFLQDHMCFGQHYAKSVSECKNCMAPVIVDGELLLTNELCEARTKGAESPSRLKTLTTREVMSRLERGRSVEEIFREILGEADPELQAAAARNMLYLRFRYMERDLGLPTPTLPFRKELIEYVRSQEVD